MTRRRFSEREVLECLIRQGAIVPCRLCRVAFKPEEAKDAEREHVHEIGLGGPDTVENCAYSHGECHKTQTHGNGATWTGSSRHKIAKTEPRRADKFVVNKIPLDTPMGTDTLIRCRRCGEYADGCSCAPPARSSAFSTARRA